MVYQLRRIEQLIWHIVLNNIIWICHDVYTIHATLILRINEKWLRDVIRKNLKHLKLWATKQQTNKCFFCYLFFIRKPKDQFIKRTLEKEKNREGANRRNIEWERQVFKVKDTRRIKGKWSMCAANLFSPDRIYLWAVLIHFGHETRAAHIRVNAKCII